MPTIAGRFEMLSQAGSGGMGSVFRARDLATSQFVAVKVLKLDRMFDLPRFEREAAMLASVRHPNIVDYVAQGEHEGIHFLAQEWVDGITLATHLSTIGATVREAILIAYGVACALGAIHTRDVIHRDIKPPNIILAGGAADQVKLVDFGIARQTDGAGVLTRTGMLVGTPSYMSPEQARGDSHLTPAADVWSLGCVLFEAMTGRPPFVGVSPTAIRAKLLFSEAPPIEQFCPEAPIELVRLLDAMLAKQPEARPSHGDVIVSRIEMLPPCADGPRRRGGKASKTPSKPIATGSAPHKTPNCVVMFDAPSVRQADSAHDRRVAEIGQRHGMDVHVFEDGSAVLAGRSQAAVAAVRAAMELRREIADAAVSVCAAADVDDTIAEIIDRGSVLLERATMGTLFGDVVDGDSGDVVHLDDNIAELLVEEIPVERGPDGVVVRVK